MITHEPWKQTLRGRVFMPLEPRPGDFDIEEIACVLSRLVRFGGHTRRDLSTYSVAEHSVRVSHACDPADALEGLLHDGAEAFVSDVTAPVKEAMRALQGSWHGSRRSPFDVIEDGICRAMAERFGLRFPWPPSVKRADLVLLATEARDLMAPPPQPWGLPYEPLPGRIEPWAPERAEAEFLLRFAELVGARDSA